MKQTSFYRQNLSLALPIILSFVGQCIVQMADTIMVGRLGTNELAAVAFAGTVTYNAMVLGMGIAMGLTPLVGQFFARGDKQMVSRLFENSLSLNSFMSLFIVALLLGMMPLLKYFGQPQEVIAICKPYYFVVALSFIPQMLFLSFKQFTEGIGNTKVSMAITIGANVLNIFLNWVLIYGKFGFPCLGVLGAGVATLIARILMPISFIIYMYSHKEMRSYFSLFQRKWLSFYEHVRLLRVGLPIAGQMFVEFFSLLGITIMMGWKSAADLAAYQIVLTMFSTTFQSANGVSCATTVLVSHAFGRGNLEELKHHFKAGLVIALSFMVCFALIFIFLGHYIACVFSTDSHVISIASTFFIVAGFFQIFDGTQVSMLGGLRGIKDVIKPMRYACISYVLVAVPVAYICGFVFCLGSWSIFAGFMAGLICAATLYYRRFKSCIARYAKEGLPIKNTNQ